MRSDDCPDLTCFLHGERDPAGFTHREQVRMPFELLRRHEFAESLLHYTRALRAMLARAGRPESFNLTVTIALLSLIAERMQRSPGGDFAGFARAHPELFGGSLLPHWYRPERLASDAAHRAFLMPDPAWGDRAALPD